MNWLVNRLVNKRLFRGVLDLQKAHLRYTEVDHARRRAL